MHKGMYCWAPHVFCVALRSDSIQMQKTEASRIIFQMRTNESAFSEKNTKLKSCQLRNKWRHGCRRWAWGLLCAGNRVKLSRKCKVHSHFDFIIGHRTWRHDFLVRRPAPSQMNKAHGSESWVASGTGAYYKLRVVLNINKFIEVFKLEWFIFHCKS